MVNRLFAEPLTLADARLVLRRIMLGGFVRVSRHAQDEMQNDDLDLQDCLATLRSGWPLPAEMERGTWRYPIVAGRICVVIAFRSPIEAVIVTAWRIWG